MSAIVPIEFGGLSNSLDITKTPKGKAFSMQSASVRRGILGGGPGYSEFWKRTGYDPLDVCYGGTVAKFANNKVYRLRVSGGTPSSGTFTITFDQDGAGGVASQTTANVNWNTTGTETQVAIDALSNVDFGDIRVYGGPFPQNDIYIELQQNFALSNTPTIAVTSSLSAGTVVASVFIAGGVSEMYLALIKKNGDSTATLYSIDMDAAESSVVVGLDPSDIFFAQHKNKIYSVNEVDRLNYHRMGGTWNDLAGAVRPSRPNRPMSFTYGVSRPRLDFSSAGLNASGAHTSSSGVHTLAFTFNPSNIAIKLTSASITDDVTFDVTITMAANQDWQDRDYLEAVVYALTTGNVQFVPGSLVVSLINAASTTIAPFSSVDPNFVNNSAISKYFSYAGRDRTTRDDVKKVLCQFTVAEWVTNKSMSIALTLGDVYMHDSVPVTPKSPKLDKIEYACSYRVTTTGAESDLSDSFFTTKFGPEQGNFVTLSAFGSTRMLNTDRVWFYRKEKSTGLWRRLPVDANNLGTYGVANSAVGASVTFVDSWMEDELGAFPVPTGIAFPGAAFMGAGVVIGTMKGAIAIGCGRRCWLSYVDGPESFAPDPDNKEAVTQFAQREQDVIDVGRSFYVATNRAEEIRGFVDQDSFYMGCEVSTMVAVGDTPVELSKPRPMPGLRGPTGKRTMFGYAGGCAIGAPDGLFYLAVGRGFNVDDNGALSYDELTKDVRRSYRETLAPSSAACMWEHEDELWLFEGGKYMRFNRDGVWEEGTFADSVIVTLANRSRGNRVLDSTGRILTIDEDLTTYDGAEFNWEMRSGILEGPRTKIECFEVLGRGKPRIQVKIWSSIGEEAVDEYGPWDLVTMDAEFDGQVQRIEAEIPAGYRYQFIFSGVAGRDYIDTLWARVDGAARDFGA